MQSVNFSLTYDMSWKLFWVGEARLKLLKFEMDFPLSSTSAYLLLLMLTVILIFYTVLCF